MCPSRQSKSANQTWLPLRRVQPLFATLSTLPLADSSRVLGTLILGAPGSGKTQLESLCLLVDLLRGLPGVVLDPLGTLSEAFLFRLASFLSEFPPGEDERLWQRLRYIPLGDEHFVTPFPIYAKQHGESLWDAGYRLITVLERANPQLVSGSPLTWPAARRLAVNAGMLLTAMGYQLTKMHDLLFNTIEWEHSGKFQEAIRRDPQAAEAVSYFQNSYLPLPRPEKSRLAGTLFDQIFPLIANPTLQAVFSGSNTAGIVWEEVEAHPQIVMFSFKGITNPAARSFAMHWIWEHLYGHLKTRGRRKTPFVVMIDEFAHLAQAGTAENKPPADLFDEFLAQYARNNRIFVTAACQSVDQLDERLRQTVFRLGTLISGRAGSFREARSIADHLMPKDIHRVQHYTKVWGKVDPPTNSPIPDFGDRTFNYRSLERQLSPYYPYYILDYEPVFMSLENQTEEAAGKIQKLGDLEFLCRPAVGEGTVSQDVISLTLSDALRDPDTGQWQFPDPEQDAARIAQLQHALAKRSGIPITEIITEQENRLTQETLKTPQQAPLQPALQSGEEVRRKDAAQPAPGNVMETPSLPVPDDAERQFLTFISEHPDTPVSSLYKALGVGVWKGNKIRDSLKAKGFLAEVELRTDSMTAGRPAKFVILTHQAFTLFGIAPPHGRGGVLHRHIQHVIQDGATTKGYTVTCEKVLDTGPIVDVHLENGYKKIAVKIAIFSTPEREIAHIRNCLTAGYDQVYVIFADENLLARIATVIQETFSGQDAGKVRLLPLRQLPHIG